MWSHNCLRLRDIDMIMWEVWSHTLYDQNIDIWSHNRPDHDLAICAHNCFGSRDWYIHRLMIVVMWHWHWHGHFIVYVLSPKLWSHNFYHCNIAIWTNNCLYSCDIGIWSHNCQDHVTLTYGPMKVCGSMALANDHITAYDLNYFYT